MALLRKWQWTKQLIQEDENIRGDTFEWNIPRFLENNLKMMKNFGWGKYICWLSINGTATKNIYNIYLRCNEPSFFKNVHFYKLSLINRQRQVFLSTSGNQLAVTDNLDIILIRFCANHFMTNSEEALTICLSLNTWTDRGAHEKMTQTTPDRTSEKKPPNFLEALSNDFGRLYKSMAYPDCVLRVGTAQFLVHRAVLSARSTVFADMFHPGTPESISGIVNISEVDVAVINDVLYFIYTGQIQGLTTDSAALMYAMANKFGVMDLKAECLDFLKRSLNVGNICDAALLAHNYEETELEESVVLFMKCRLDEIQESVEWKILSHYKPLLASKLLNSTTSKLLNSTTGKLLNSTTSKLLNSTTSKLLYSAPKKKKKRKRFAKQNKKSGFVKYY